MSVAVSPAKTNKLVRVINDRPSDVLYDTCIKLRSLIEGNGNIIDVCFILLKFDSIKTSIIVNKSITNRNLLQYCEYWKYLCEKHRDNPGNRINELNEIIEYLTPLTQLC